MLIEKVVCILGLAVPEVSLLDPPYSLQLQIMSIILSINTILKDDFKSKAKSRDTGHSYLLEILNIKKLSCML